MFISTAAPSAGTIMGTTLLPMELVDEYLAAKSEESGVKLTITHFIIKVIAFSLARVPSFNGRIYMDHVCMG